MNNEISPGLTQNVTVGSNQPAKYLAMSNEINSMNIAISRLSDLRDRLIGLTEKSCETDAPEIAINSVVELLDHGPSKLAGKRESLEMLIQSLEDALL